NISGNPIAASTGIDSDTITASATGSCAIQRQTVSNAQATCGCIEYNATASAVSCISACCISILNRCVSAIAAEADSRDIHGTRRHICAAKVENDFAALSVATITHNAWLLTERSGIAAEGAKTVGIYLHFADCETATVQVERRSAADAISAVTKDFNQPFRAIKNLPTCVRAKTVGRKIAAIVDSETDVTANSRTAFSGKAVLIITVTGTSGVQQKLGA